MKKWNSQIADVLDWMTDVSQSALMYITVLYKRQIIEINECRSDSLKIIDDWQLPSELSKNCTWMYLSTFQPSAITYIFIYIEV